MSDLSDTTSDSENNEIFLNQKKYQNTKDYKQTIKNDISKMKEDLTNLFNKYLKYIETLKNNVNKYLERNLEQLMNNIDVMEINYSSIEKNLKKVLQSINEVINIDNIKKEEIEKSLINYFPEKQIIKNESFQKLKVKKTVIGSEPKIENMKKMRLVHKNQDNKINTEYTCYSPLNDKNYMIFGNTKGEVEIYNFNNSSINEDEEKYVLRLRIKAFNDEVKNICELDKDLFAVSGRNNEIKIIECQDNISKYKIIQTIYINDYDDSNIYSMISLPLLSSQKNKHFLSVATDTNILIYQSNKTPKFLNYFDNENYQDLSFELYKTIELYTLTCCLIEANNKYLFAACPKEESIKIFDMTNDFIEDKTIEDINLTFGNNIFTVIPNKDKLIVACKDGFKYISISKKKKFKSIHCSYSVLCLDMLSENTFICSCSENNKKIIKQYEINNDNYQLIKQSQISNKHNDEIWKLQKVNERIFYIDNKKIINYLV